MIDNMRSNETYDKETLADKIRKDMNLKFLKEFSKKIKDKHRYICIYGSSGSGKSYFTAQLVLYLAMTQPNNILVCRGYMKQNRDSTFRLLEDLIHKYNIKCKINKSSLEMEFESGCIIFFRGAKEPEKLKSINNVTIGWIEEADELSLEDFLIVNGRIRGDETSKIFLTFNPTSDALWIKDNLIEGEYRKETLTIHATLNYNKYIDKRYVKNLEKLKNVNEEHYLIYKEGKWATSLTSIFPNYEIKHFKFKYEYGNMYIGLDFGYNNPTACVLVQKIDNKLYVKELFYQTKLLTKDIIEKLKEYRDYIIYADNSEPDRIEEIRKNGFKIFPAIKNVKGSIDYIKMHKIIISPTSENFINEIKNYKWKKDKSGNILDEPVKSNDHLIDAFRYAIYTPYKLKHFGSFHSNLKELIKCFPI